MGWFERWWIVVPSMALAVMLMLHACLKTGFHDGDDKLHIVTSLSNQWSDFKNLSISALPLARFSYRVDYYLFRPANQPAQLSDSVDYEGLSSWAPAVRCMSGLYHLLAAVILWCFLRRMKAPGGVAYLVALVWAAHPSACESVCWVSERKTVLTALFGFAALLVWTADRRHLWRLPLAYFLFVLANLCKGSALGFLPIFAALEFFAPHHQELKWTSLQRLGNVARCLAIPILICAGAMDLNVSNHVRELVDPPGGSVFTAMLTDVEIFGRYAINTLIPYGLSYFYGVRPIQSLADYRLWLFGALEAGMIAGLFAMTERAYRSLYIFGLIWFLGALGPNSNLIATPYWMQDRYMYTAMPGLLLSVALAVRGALPKLEIEFNPARLALVGSAYAVLVVALLIQRAALYCDTETLIVDAAMRQPLSSQARRLYGQILKKEFLKYTPDGSQPDREQARHWGYAAAAQYAAAVNCPDIVNFDDPFGVKNNGVDVLLQIGDYEAARQSLQGWLPPPHLSMMKVKRNDGSTVLTRQMMLRGYMPQTLAHAWAIMAESSIAQSQASGLAPQDRLALLSRAMQEAHAALEVWDKEDEPQIVTAKVLLFTACAEAENHNLESSKEKFDQGMAILKSLPQDTPHASVAQYWISHPPVSAAANSGSSQPQ